MSNRYRDSMDRLHFTQEQKQEMVDRLMEAGPVSSVRPLLRFRRFAAVGAAAALALSLGVAGATGALGSAGDAFAGLFGGGPAETEIIDRIGTKERWVNRPAADPSELAIASIREGTVPGIHTVTYTSADDVLTDLQDLKLKTKSFRVYFSFRF